MRRLWPWLRLLIGVGILAVLAWRLGTEAFLAGLRVVNAWSLLAALGIGVLTTVLSAWRWCVVARRLGLRLPLGTAIADYYRALLLNAILPAGVLGDVHRAVSHGRQSGDMGRGVRAVVLERFAGQVITVATGLAVLLRQPALLAALGRDLAPDRGILFVLLIAVLLTVAIVVVVKWGNSAARWRRAIVDSLADARATLLHHRTLVPVVLISCAVFAGHVVLYVIAARTAGLTAPLDQVLPLIALALLAMGLPINIGGWGPREAVSALAFGAAGLGATEGLTAAVVYGVLALIAALPGLAVIFLRRSRTAPDTDRELVTEQG
jgi:uncharacterized membrane protein YbhN (UPF0104 family)